MRLGTIHETLTGNGAKMIEYSNGRPKRGFRTKGRHLRVSDGLVAIDTRARIDRARNVHVGAYFVISKHDCLHVSR